jgi:uncharacterized sulfatase
MILLLVAAPLFAQDNAATRKLAAQSKQFEKQIVKVADNVHVAVGFSPANVSMIEGEDGLIIVDTGMSVDDGTLIMEEFREMTRGHTQSFSARRESVGLRPDFPSGFGSGALSRLKIR